MRAHDANASMLRRLLDLAARLAMLRAPASSRRRRAGSSRSWSPRDPRRPAARSSSRSTCGPTPGWHGYWLNPGDAGLPMDVQWQLPKGFSAGPLRYPVPTRLTVAGLMNYVYERDYAVLVRLKVPAGASGTVPIRADAHWLACTDKICVPEQGELALDLPVGNGTPNRAQFDAWRQALAAAAGDGRPFRGRRRQAARRDPASGERRGRRALSVPDHRRCRRLRGAAEIPPRGRLARRRAASEEGAPTQIRRRAGARRRPRARVPRRARAGSARRNADRRARLEARCCGRCSARLPAASCST